MRARDERVVDGADRGGGRLVDVGQRDPSCRDLHRVDDVLARDQRLERADVVAVPEPRSSRRRRRGLRPRRTRRRRRSSSRRPAPGRPRRGRAAGGLRSGRSGRSGRPRWRRRAGAPRASPRGGGCAGTRRARRRTSANAYAARRSVAGVGCSRSRAPVMTPSVPSEPTNSWVRSGPTAARGAPPVVIARPSASTTSRPTTMSSIFP